MTTADVLRFIERQADDLFGGEHWTTTVATKVARGLLAALRDYGLLLGTHKKTLHNIPLPVPAFAIIARLRYDLGYRGAAGVTDEVWRLFLLSGLGVERFYAAAMSENLLEYQSAGKTVRITFPEMPLEEFASYAVVAMTMVAIFLGELLRSRASFPLLVTGFGFLVISLVVDFFATEGTSLAGVEDPTNVVGTGFILSAYLVKLREVWSELPGTTNSLAPGGLPSVV